MSQFVNQFSSVQRFLFFFTKKLRLSNPWKFKVPFLISIPYFLFLLSCYKNNSLPSVLASICIIVGVAGFGYLTNDLGDRNKDRLIQKENASAEISFTGIFFLFFLFLTLAILPWFYLAIDIWSCCLLVLEFMLFYLYAFPPFRLKEKGIFGVITDALYAHAIPSVLAAYTFYLYTDKTVLFFYWFVTALAIWQFVLGLRNILLHQLTDLDKDLASGTETFVIQIGLNKTANLIQKIILPLETLLFIVFSAFVAHYMLFFFPVILFYWLIVFFKRRSLLKTMTYRDYAYFFLDDLYIQWIPLIVLAGLIMQSFYFIPVAVMHLLIFRNGIKTFLIQKFKK